MAGPRYYKIEAKPGANWLDLTNYVRADWGADGIGAEDRHGEFNTGPMSFVIHDKGNPGLATHSWITALAQATGDVPVRVSESFGDTAPPVYTRVFYGYLEPGQFAYEGDVITGFTACGMLQFADRIDAAPARNGEAAITTHSGHASTLATTMLRKLGFTTGTAADVSIKDYKLGDTQADADWNHPKRYYGTARADLDAEYPLGDLVPAHLGDDVRGFYVEGGRLYRLTDTYRGEVLDNDGNPYTTTACRLATLQSYAGGATHECLAVVEGRREQVKAVSWRPTSEAWGAVQSGVALTGTAVSLAFPPAALIASGVSLALSGVERLTRRAMETATGEYRWIATKVVVLNVGDGTNGPSGVGRVIGPAGSPAQNQDYTLPTPTARWFTLVDHLCTSGGNSVGNSVGVLWRGETGEHPDHPSGLTNIYRTYWDTARLRWEGQRVVTDADGRPMGGMAASQECVLVGYPGGYRVAVRTDGDLPFEYVDTVYDRPPGRFIGSIASNQTVGGVPYRYITWVYGNSTNLAVWTAFDINGSRPSSVVVNTTSITPSDAATVYVLNSTSRYEVVGGVATRGYLHVTYACASPRVAGRENDNNVKLYLGSVYVDHDAIGTMLEDSYATYPLSNNVGFGCRAPLLWLDQEHVGTTDIYRYLTVAQYADDGRYLTDIYISSCYARAYLHIDLQRNPMTIGDILRGMGGAFLLYLRLNDVDACNSDDDVRVVSRFAWTPAGAGTLSTDEVGQSPRVNGVEYYLGAQAQVGGERITGGTVTVGSRGFVANVNSAFLTRNWARASCAYIAARYPRTSATYPFGRRLFEVNARCIDTSGTERILGFKDLFKTCVVTFMTGLNTSAIIRSIGFDRKTLAYRLKLIEYGVSGGVGDGVDWTADEPASDTVDSTFGVEDTYTAPTEATPTYAVYDWDIDSEPLLDRRANPTPALACAYAFTVKQPGIKLLSYLYGVFDTCTGDDAGLWLECWADGGGKPGTPIAGSRALVLPDERTIGGYYQQVLGDGVLREANLPNGEVWLVVVVDGDANVTAAPYEWSTGTATGWARALYVEFAVGQKASWLTAWPTSDTKATNTVPAIYLAGG